MVIPATFCGQKSYVFFTRLWHDCLFHSWFSACMYVCLSLSSSLIFFHGNTYIPAMINPYCIVLAKNLLDCYGKATAKKSSIELAKTWWIAATEEDLFSSSFFFFQVRTLLKAAPEFHICCALCCDLNVNKSTKGVTHCWVLTLLGLILYESHLCIGKS